MLPSSFQSCPLKLEVKDNHFALFPAHKFYWRQICSTRKTALKEILCPDKWGSCSLPRGITYCLQEKNFVLVFLTSANIQTFIKSSSSSAATFFFLLFLPVAGKGIAGLMLKTCCVTEIHVGVNTSRLIDPSCQFLMGRGHHLRCSVRIQTSQHHLWHRFLSQSWSPPRASAYLSLFLGAISLNYPFWNRAEPSTSALSLKTSEHLRVPV